jgi:hypothetical protein
MDVDTLGMCDVIKEISAASCIRDWRAIRVEAAQKPRLVQLRLETSELSGSGWARSNTERTCFPETMVIPLVIASQAWSHAWGLLLSLGLYHPARDRLIDASHRRSSSSSGSRSSVVDWCVGAKKETAHVAVELRISGSSHFHIQPVHSCPIRVLGGSCNELFFFTVTLSCPMRPL